MDKSKENVKDKEQEFLDSIKRKPAPYIWPTWIIVVFACFALISEYIGDNQIPMSVGILLIILIVAMTVVCEYLVKYYRLFKYTYVIIPLFPLWIIYHICKQLFNLPF